MINITKKQYMDKTRRMIGVPPNNKQLFLAETQESLIKIHNPSVDPKDYPYNTRLGSTMPGWIPQTTTDTHPDLINAKNIFEITLVWYQRKQQEIFISRLLKVDPHFDFKNTRINGVIELKEKKQYILETKP